MTKKVKHMTDEGDAYKVNKKLNKTPNHDTNILFPGKHCWSELFSDMFHILT